MADKRGVFKRPKLSNLQTAALSLLIEEDLRNESDAKEWLLKMALMSNDPAHYAPKVLGTPGPADISEADFDEGGISSDVVLKYDHVPTPEEYNRIISQFPNEVVLGANELRLN